LNFALAHKSTAPHGAPIEMVEFTKRPRSSHGLATKQPFPFHPECHSQMFFNSIIECGCSDQD